MKIKYIITCLILFVALPCAAQYRSPLDIPLSMTANFAELRSNHFHSGVDYRVGGVAGAKLYAVEDGFVSHIVVSPNGYGKAIYIEHPNGQTSLYGHLDRFAGKIAEHVKEYQYARQRFIVSEYLDSTTLIVKKGDLIGYAGNSGNSFGAHLHFEIRESQRQMPLNLVVKGYYKVNDNLPPTVHRVAVFTLDSLNGTGKPRLLKAEKAIKQGENFVPEKTRTFDVCNPVFFGISANDYQPNNTSRHGINMYKAYIDDKLFFAYALNEFEFKETRYINSLISYEELKKSKTTYVKTYIEPGNILPVYMDMKGDGLIWLTDTLPHKLRIELYDDSGNKSALNFRIRNSGKVSQVRQMLNPARYLVMPWNDIFEYHGDGVKVSIPKNSLYSDALFTVNKSTREGALSAVWKLGDANIPLQNKMTVEIKPDNLPPKLSEKALIVRINDNGKQSACGGQMNIEGYLSCEVQEFGSYCVAADTVAPVISLSGKTKDFSNQSKISLTIKDNLSGVGTYAGYIDGNWALFDYDAKNSLLTYIFDAARLKKGQMHKLKVTVTDNCKNSASFNTDFKW